MDHEHRPLNARSQLGASDDDRNLKQKLLVGGSGPHFAVNPDQIQVAAWQVRGAGWSGGCLSWPGIFAHTPPSTRTAKLIRLGTCLKLIFCSPFSFCCLLLAVTLTQLWLSQRRVRHVMLHRAKVPPQFAGTVDLAAHQKAADYTAAKSQLGLTEVALHRRAHWLDIDGG